MRKQSARIGLSFAVLPITAFAIHGLPSASAHPGKHHSAWQGHTTTGPHGRHHLARTTPTDAAAHSSVNQVGVQLLAASSQVLAQGQVIRQNDERAAYLAAQQRASVPRHASPAPAASFSQPAPAPEPQPTVSVSDSMASVLACIRQYESGDNYGDTSNPYYRGAYQFSWSTWQAVGGSGDPAAASPSEQDMRAEMLAERDGWSAWSTASLCGV